MGNKPIHAKPSLYAFYFEQIKEIGLEFGYNVVLHGSMNRDLDLIAIPWVETTGDVEKMIDLIAQLIGGVIMMVGRTVDNPDGKRFTVTHHGRRQYVININRDIKFKYNGVVAKLEEFSDPQYYIDISVIPVIHYSSNMNQVKQYIKRPIKVSAIQYNGNSDKARIEEFVGKELKVELESETAYVAGQGPPYFSLLIETKEGVMKAMPGDYIIQEPFPTPDRDFYPCKPDIFVQNYDLVEAENVSTHLVLNANVHSKYTDENLIHFVVLHRYALCYTDFYGQMFISSIYDEIARRGIDLKSIDLEGKYESMVNEKNNWHLNQQKYVIERTKKIHHEFHIKALKSVSRYAYATVFSICSTILCLFYGISQFPDWSISAKGQLIHLLFWINAIITIVLLTLTIIKNKEVNTLDKNLNELPKT